MANNKNPNEKQPGENPEGKYHFNPGMRLATVFGGLLTIRGLFSGHIA